MMAMIFIQVPKIINRLKKLSSGGFTLVEVIAVVAIIAMMMSIALPQMHRPKGSTKWKNVALHFNKLARIAQKSANRLHARCRLSLKSIKGGGGSLVVEREELFADGKTTPAYHQINDMLSDGSYEVNQGIEIVDCFVPSSSKGATKEEKQSHYCYFMPHGLADSMIVHLIRDDDFGVSKQTLQMSPFLGSFQSTSGFVPFPKQNKKG
jgi:prepilin-type N-terminal cleavage/methylation domain-containing protein